MSLYNNNPPRHNSFQQSYSRTSERQEEQLTIDTTNVLSKQDIKKFIEDAKEVAGECKGSAGKGQVRQLYSILLEARGSDEEKRKNAILKFEIQAKYKSARGNLKSHVSNTLIEIANKIISDNFSAEKFNNFVDFMEAVVAYSKE